MNIKKVIMVGIVAMVAVATFAVTPVVTDVTAKQRYPWNGMVDITCAVSGISGTTNLKFSVAAVQSGNVHEAYPFWVVKDGTNPFWVVKDGTNSTDRTVHTNGTYHLVWDSKVDFDNKICSNMVMRVKLVDLHDKVQLWANGPYWATTNIGAEKPEDYGYYFWWGDTIGYKRLNDAWVASDGSSANFSFKWDSTPTCDKNTATLQSEGWITADSILAPEHDAAHVQWGGSWRMPTKQELDDLNSNCDWTWMTLNGVNGFVVRGKGEYSFASIFIPAAGLGDSSGFMYGDFGQYWSSVSDPDGGCSWGLYYYATGHIETFNENRYNGQPVRPVQGFTGTNMSMSTVTISFDANGGMASATSQTYIAYSLYGSLPTATRTGYMFAGWFTAESGGEQVMTFSFVPAADTTLYAHWTDWTDSHKVQLWANGPYWATKNIGAEKPEDYGYKFWWGDTIGYKRVNDAWVASDGSSANFAFDQGNTPTYGKDAAILQSEGWITADGVLASAHDAAQVQCGGSWRMPTRQEVDDLNNNCDWTWTTMNGVNGFVVRGRGDYASASIFLPVAGYGFGASFGNAGWTGYYWSSVPDSDIDAWHLGFTSSSHRTSVFGLRYHGLSVRPVQEFTQ